MNKTDGHKIVFQALLIEQRDDGYFFSNVLREFSEKAAFPWEYVTNYK